MKTFKGFTPQQQHVLLGKLGYQGPLNQAEMEKFMAASPNAASKMGSWAEQAKKRVEGIQTKKFNTGGVVDSTTSPTQTTASSTQTEAAAPIWLNNKEAQTGNSLNNIGLVHPGLLTSRSVVSNIAETPGQIIEEGTGQQGEVDTVTPSTVTNTQTATATPKTETATVDPSIIGEKVKEELSGVKAATADPSAKATVRGQLEELMSDFEQGTPPWASGAMRQAMGVMQQRGMGASSMAGQAIVQAAMEAAVGIAAQDANTFAQFELQNLNNEQQTTIFKTQQTVASMFSDQAADNAAQQFNAASKNQTDQFFAELQTTVSRFNAEQVNATLRFNAGEENVAKQFNSQLKAVRDQFNAANDLIIAQANAQWRQDIATTNTRVQNEANMEAARQANGLTQRAMDQIWQRERDLLNFAFASSESEDDRNLSILLADRNIAQSNQEISASRRNSRDSALGAIAGQIFGGLF